MARFPPFLLAIVILFSLAACTSGPRLANTAGVHRCEAFFIYEICIADRDRDHAVDFMYFGDDLQIFMYDVAQRDALEDVQPFHECAVPMSRNIRETSTELLYADDLSLTQRLALKGSLIKDYREAQPAIDACNTGRAGAAAPAEFDDPFLIDEGWDEEWDEDGLR
jgi:hypothetical protein